MDTIISKLISGARKNLNMTQEQLAEKLGVSAQAVSKWENGWNLPDIDNLKQISEYLSIPLAKLMGEDSVEAQFDYRSRLFNEDKMFTRVRTIAQTEHFYETYRALSFMREHHEGQFRKKGKHTADIIPYINHPLMMAVHAYYLGIRDDAILAAILLHDVVEDTGVKLEELPFTDEIKEIVGLVTFTCPKGMDKAEAKKAYYDKIKTNPKACVVKMIDRCNNVSTMAATFTKEKIVEYVDETEKYVLPVLTKVKNDYPEYADTTFVVKYHIISILETVKNLM